MAMGRVEFANGVGISYGEGEWRYSSGLAMSHRGPFKQVQLERVSVCNLLTRRGEETEVLQHFAGEKRYVSTGANVAGRDELARFLKLERRI